MVFSPKEKQSFHGLLDHLATAFQFSETVSSLIADFDNWAKPNEAEMHSWMNYSSG